MGDNYVAMGVTLVVWFGLFAFLMRLDTKVRKLEKRSK